MLRESLPPDLTFGGCVCIRTDGRLLAESRPRIGAEIMTEKENSADEVRDHATDDSYRVHREADAVAGPTWR